MRILMHSEEDLDIRDFLEPEMTVESHDPEAVFSALQMFATSLALCSFSVLYSYAETIGVEPASIGIRIRWSYATDVGGIDEIAMDIDWPGLPDSRKDAARRVAASCTLHRTLEHSPQVHTRVG
ncbi:MAG: OsmC family protein [Thiohalomonadaceae bacterium]